MLYRHKMRGTSYRILHDGATLQCKSPAMDGKSAVVYQDIIDSSVHVRATDEFYDGRFEVLQDLSSGPELPAEMRDLIWNVIYADRRTNAADRQNYPDENAERIEAWNKLEAAILALVPATAPQEHLSASAQTESEPVAWREETFGQGKGWYYSEKPWTGAQPLYVAPSQTVSDALARELAGYDATIAAAKADAALSDSGRQRIIERCLDAKGAIAKFARALSRPQGKST